MAGRFQRSATLRTHVPAPAHTQRPRRSALVALATVFLLVTLAPPSHARPSAKKAIWGPAYDGATTHFGRYRDLGVGIYQESINWGDIAPQRPAAARDPWDPAYRWPAALDRTLAAARANRMTSALMLIGAPAWANGGHPWNWAPTRSRDFADFAYAASRRYPTVNFWMVWGEPSREHNFEPLTPAPPGRRLTARQASAPRRYARMLDAAYGALKRAGPRDRVVGGMTYSSGDISTWQWVANLRLPNGRPPRLDMYGHNPFTWRPPNLGSPPSCCGLADFSDLGRLGGFVDRNLAPRRRARAQRHIPFFLSEFMLPTDVDAELNFHVSRETQAAWIRDIMRIVRRSARIQVFGWIHLRDDPPRSDGQPGISSGLLDHRGTPKPGYYAFKAG